MSMYLKFAKASIITCIPLGNSEISWYPNCWENDKLFYNITPGLLQQSLLWVKSLQYIPATALPEKCRPDVVLVPQIRSYIQHIFPSCCLCILRPGPCDQRTKISSECQDAVWKGLVDAALRMPLHPFGTLYLHLLNEPLPLIPSRAAWRLIYLMWRIPRFTESYIVWVYCLWLIFSVFYLQVLLRTVTSHHFLN